MPRKRVWAVVTSAGFPNPKYVGGTEHEVIDAMEAEMRGSFATFFKSGGKIEPCWIEPEREMPKQEPKLSSPSTAVFPDDDIPF